MCRCLPTVLYHGAEGGGAVCRHGGGGVAICRCVGPHQEGAAVYGVLPLLTGRRGVWHRACRVGNIGLEPVTHGVHLARHDGNPTMPEVHVEEAVWVYGGFVWRRGVVRMLDVGVFVGCIRRRRLLEMKSASLPIIGQMQGSEASAEGVRAIVKAWDSSSKVKVVH